MAGGDFELEFDVDLSAIEQLVEQGLEAVHAATRLVATDLWGNIRRESPVDEGRLAGSFELEQVSDDEWRIFTNVLYALFVEEGTGIFGPYGTPIVPVTASRLVFEVNGQLVFAKSVQGMEPRRYVASAMEATEARLDDFVELALREVGAL